MDTRENIEMWYVYDTTGYSIHYCQIGIGHGTNWECQKHWLVMSGTICRRLNLLLPHTVCNLTIHEHSFVHYCYVSSRCPLLMVMWQVVLNGFTMYGGTCMLRKSSYVTFNTMWLVTIAVFQHWCNIKHWIILLALGVRTTHYIRE